MSLSRKLVILVIIIMHWEYFSCHMHFYRRRFFGERIVKSTSWLGSLLANFVVMPYTGQLRSQGLCSSSSSEREMRGETLGIRLCTGIIWTC